MLEGSIAKGAKVESRLAGKEKDVQIMEPTCVAKPWEP